MKATTFKNTLLATLLLLAFTTNIFAAKQDVEAPAGFEEVKTRQLDTAWVNPKFNPKDYDTIVVRWGDFEYRPTKKYRRNAGTFNNNFEMPQWAKAKMQTDAYKEFAKQLGNVEGFELVEIQDADNRTMAINLTLTEIVNHVPNPKDVGVRHEVYTKKFGAMTLEMQFTDLTTGQLLFKGAVRDNIEAIGMDFERATPIIAANKAKWQLKRWAKGLEKGLDKMK